MALAWLTWAVLLLGASTSRIDLPGSGSGVTGARELEAGGEARPHRDVGAAEDGESLLAVSADAQRRELLPARRLALVAAALHMDPSSGQHSDMAGSGSGDRNDVDDDTTWLQDWLDSFGRLKPPPDTLGLTEDPALTEIRAKTSNGIRLWLTLPKAWAAYFSTGGAKAVGMRWERGVCMAKFVSSSGRSVAFRSAPAAAITTQRMLRIIELLRSCAEAGCGHIVRYLDMQTFDDRVFMLLEAADETIEEFVSRQSGDGHGDGGLIVPLNRSIPILIDVLRCLGALESVGILHGGVSAKSIVLVDGRAVIDGLDAACLAERMDDEEVWVPCQALTDSWPNDLLTSPFWQMGDVIDGSPTEPRDSSWSAGVLLAYMCLGVNPVERHVSEFDAELALGAHSSPTARRTIRREVRDHFRIDDAPGFSSLDADVQRLLSGLLAIDPKKRLDTSAALREAEALAERRGIDVAPPRIARTT